MKRITQHQAIFYQLYRNRKDGENAFIPIWKLIGEVYVAELGQHAFVSYEVSARMSELWGANPGLFAREQTRGVSGAKYYQYRIHNQATKDTIADPDLRAFYDRLERARFAKQGLYV